MADRYGGSKIPKNSNTIVQTSSSKGNDKFNSDERMKSAIITFWRVCSYLNDYQREVIWRYRKEERFISIKAKWPRDPFNFLKVYFDEIFRIEVKLLENEMDKYLFIDGREFISSRDVVSNDHFRNYGDFLEFTLILFCPIFYNYIKGCSKNCEIEDGEINPKNKSNRINQDHVSNKDYERNHRYNEIDKNTRNNRSRKRDKSKSPNKKLKEFSQNKSPSKFQKNKIKNNSNNSYIDKRIGDNTNYMQVTNSKTPSKEKIVSSNQIPITEDDKERIEQLKTILANSEEITSKSDPIININMPEYLQSIKKASDVLRNILKMHEINEKKNLGMIISQREGKYKIIVDYGSIKDIWSESMNYHYTLFCVYFQLFMKLYDEGEWRVLSLQKGILKRQEELLTSKSISHKVVASRNDDHFLQCNKSNFDKKNEHFIKRKVVTKSSNPRSNYEKAARKKIIEFDFSLKDLASFDHDDSFSKENKSQKRIKK